MPFKDHYVAPPSDFVKEKKKLELAESAEPFEVFAVTTVETKWKTDDNPDGKRYNLSVRFADGEEGTMPFAANSVFTRDDMFEQFIEYFDANPGETIPVKLTKVGRSWIVELLV